MYERFIPDFKYYSVFDIDYNLLKEKGIKALFFDLDNTLIDYQTKKFSEETKNLLVSLLQDFKVLILSNSRRKRVKRAAENLPYISFAKKPFKLSYKKACKLLAVTKDEVASIGDQLLTDINGSKKAGLKYAILVAPIKKRTEKIWTKFNRIIEQRIIKKIKKKHPDLFLERLSDYE